MRRHQHTLAVVGVGVIGFGIWSIVKSILYLTLINPLKDILLTDYQNVTDYEHEEFFVFVCTIVIVTAVALIDLHLRWKVGKKAIAISRGEQTATKGFYLRSAIVTLVDGAEFVAGVLAIAGIVSSEESLTDQISTLLVDSTSVVMLIEMIIAAVMIGKITKMIEAENAD